MEPQAGGSMWSGEPRGGGGIASAVSTSNTATPPCTKSGAESHRTRRSHSPRIPTLTLNLDPNRGRAQDTNQAGRAHCKKHQI